MLRIARVGRLVFLLPVLSLLVVAPGRAQTPPAPGRVTIRGTGSSVTLERTPAAAASSARRIARPRASAEAPFAPSAPEGVLAEVVRLKTAGADDAMALAYLRLHQGELPPVIGSEDVTALRRAGAGKPLLFALATLAAVDIGATGEGRPSPEAVAYEPAGEEEGPGYAVAYGYPAGGAFVPVRRHAFVHLAHPRPMRPPHPGHFPRPMGTTFRRDLAP